MHAINCLAGSWADNVTKYCVSRCPTDPLTFGYDSKKECTPTCPVADDLFGEFVNMKCVPACGTINGIQTY